MPPKAKKPVKLTIDPSAFETYFYVRKIKGKGQALFAKVALSRNTRIVYEGVRIDQKEYNELLKRDKKDPPKQYLAYIIAGGRKGSYIDAHPRHEGSDMWYASKVNEPSVGQTANMVMTGGVNPALVTVKDIPAGTELTVKYGSSYVRKGYRAGLAPRKPAWV